jgi:plasmid stability protein
MDTTNFDRAALVVRARKLLGSSNDELRDILRQWIAGLSPEAADAALIELFAEIDTLQEVILEQCGFRKSPPDESPTEPPF